MTRLCLRGSAVGLVLCVLLVLAWTNVSAAYEQQIKSLASVVAENIESEGRARIAVVDFTDLQGNVTELGRFIAEELAVALFGASRGFKVVDRVHIRALLQEHGLSLTGLIDPAAASRLGQIAGVDAIVTGTVTPFGDSVRISVKVLDSATAEMLSASSGDIPKTKAIEELMAKGVSPAATGVGQVGGVGASGSVGIAGSGGTTGAAGGTGVVGQAGQQQQQQQQQQQGPAASQSLAHVEVDGWVVDLLGCKRGSGKQVFCNLTITNVLDDRQLRLMTSSSSSSVRAWDDRNTQCSVSYVRVANKGSGSGITTFYVSGVPTAVTYTIDGVTPGATGIALLQILIGDKLVKFRDIPITT